MKYMITGVALALASSLVIGSDFATCILDDMPGVQNDVAAAAIFKVCRDKYPLGLDGVEQGSGRGWFGYDTGAKCAAKLAAKTPSRSGGQFIYAACNKLYNEPILLSDEDVFGKQK